LAGEFGGFSGGGRIGVCMTYISQAVRRGRCP
jgi:hypothetical protein